MKLAHRQHERCACAGLAGAPFTLAGTERQYERSRPFHVRHLLLDLEVDFEAKAVAGSATLDVVRVAPDADVLELDAVGFEIESVRYLGEGKARDAHYEYDGETLHLLGLRGHDAVRAEVRYRAEPRRGLYFLEPDPIVKDRPVQVWSQCQDEDARHWFPCHDKPHVKMTTELRVHVPAGFVALSNGDLVETEAPKTARSPALFHFKLDRPHPSYLVTLVVGQFAIIEDRDAELADGRRIPIRFYVPPDRQKDAERSFGETSRMVELFSRLTGTPFPWSRYSQVVVSDFIFGGMENTTATTMYEHVLLDARAALDIHSTDLVAHELAHQWFGDFVTCRDWSHAWLNEGFATFFEHLERENRLGPEEYDYSIQGDLETYLGEAGSRYQRPIVCRDYVEPIDLFDRHLYEKGGLVLHMLRRELGDETFWRGVARYLAAHAHGIVETNDLQRALEQVSGRSLERFFDQWVYRPGHPELKVKVSYEDGLINVAVKQNQKTDAKHGDVAVFAFELEVEVSSKDGQVTRHKKSVTNVQDALVIPSPDRPGYVAFDPELRVMGSIAFEAPGDFLRRQLERGSSALLRWNAADALAKKADPPSIAALGRALSNENEVWMVRAEAARALGKTRAPAALELLGAHTAVEQAKVRRAVASALGSFRDPRAAEALLPLTKQDASYLVEAEAARSLGKTRSPAALEPLLGMVDRASWADVVRMGVLDGLAALRSEDGIAVVQEHTRYGYPTRGRRSAISALAHLGEGKRIREHLEALFDDKDPHVRVEVVSALVTLGDARCRPALRRALDRELDGRVSRRMREALRDLGDTNTERKRVTDELESVKGELAELKARLAKLETTTKSPRAHKSNAEVTEPPAARTGSRARTKAAPKPAAKKPAKRTKAKRR